LISAPNALGALQCLCDLLRVEWNEDVRRAALCSITQLSELDVMRAVDTLVAACKQDSSGAAEEGLLAVAELLNVKILNEEEKFVEHTQQVVVEQARLEEVCVCEREREREREKERESLRARARARVCFVFVCVATECLCVCWTNRQTDRHTHTHRHTVWPFGTMYAML
jgi:hypothetical protein